MGERKKVFDFDKGFWKKGWNRLDRPRRLFGLCTILLMAASLGNIRDGLKNDEALDNKEKWIKTCLRNPKSAGFDHLDEEASPLPLSPRTGLEQFRAEFLKIRESVERQYK